MEDHGDFERVPVPREFVGEVYALLGKLMDTGGAPTVNGSGEELEEAEAELTPDLIRRIYSESHETHRRLFDFLAAHPGEWFYSDALAKELELPNGASSLAGTLGALGKRANHRYDGHKPIVSKWDYEAGQARHMMPPEVAKIIADL